MRTGRIAIGMHFMGQGLETGNGTETKNGNINREQQFGFMPRKDTTDASFVLRQLLEKYGEKRLVFMGQEKAYDSVSRDEVWSCVRANVVLEK